MAWTWLIIRTNTGVHIRPKADQEGNKLFFLHSCYLTSLQLFQNKHQQDDTSWLSFISRLVVLYSTCFELQRTHHQQFTFSTLYRQSLAYCMSFCCIPPLLLHVLFPTVCVLQQVNHLWHTNSREQNTYEEGWKTANVVSKQSISFS